MIVSKKKVDKFLIVYKKRWSLYNFILQKLIWKMITVYFLWFDYWTFKEWKTAKVQNHSAAAYYLHKWLVYLLKCLLYFFFLGNSYIFIYKPRTTLCPFWQPGPPGLTFYGSGLECLPSWLGMVNADWLYSIRSKIFLQMKFIIFQGCPTKLPFYLGSLLHIISSFSSHFRSWDYPEHFGMYSQLDRKSKTWFFTFLDVCMFACIHENEFWQFSNTKMNITQTEFKK